MVKLKADFMCQPLNCFAQEGTTQIVLRETCIFLQTWKGHKAATKGSANHKMSNQSVQIQFSLLLTNSSLHNIN